MKTKNSFDLPYNYKFIRYSEAIEFCPQKHVSGVSIKETKSVLDYLNTYYKPICKFLKKCNYKKRKIL